MMQTLNNPFWFQAVRQPNTNDVKEEDFFRKALYVLTVNLIADTAGGEIKHALIPARCATCSQNYANDINYKDTFTSLCLSK